MRLAMVLIVIGAVLMGASNLSASVLISSRNDGSAGAGERFYRLDQTNASATQIGVSAVAEPRDLTSDTRAASARLWATDVDANRLVRVDPLNASSTIVGSFGTVGDNMRTLAFDETTGRMYGTTVGNSLYEINPETAASTLIAQITGATNIGSLGCDSAGNLWAHSEASGTGLYKINKTTAIATFIGSAPVQSGVITDIAFRPEDDTLFAIANNGNLYTLNQTTAVPTLVGAHGGGFLVGLAFATVPEPGTMAIASLVSGAMLLRRPRRRHP